MLIIPHVSTWNSWARIKHDGGRAAYGPGVVGHLTMPCPLVYLFQLDVAKKTTILAMLILLSIFFNGLKSYTWIVDEACSTFFFFTKKKISLLHKNTIKEV